MDLAQLIQWFAEHGGTLIMENDGGERVIVLDIGAITIRRPGRWEKHSAPAELAAVLRRAKSEVEGESK